MPITINGSGTITGASTLATTVASPTLTTPNINSAQFATVSGTAPLYTARAWVNFNGTGTVAIRASGNVTSITDGGTGNYTVNFTTAMPDANYATHTEVGGTASVTQHYFPPSGTYTSSAVRIQVGNIGFTADADAAIVNVSVFR